MKCFSIRTTFRDFIVLCMTKFGLPFIDLNECGVFAQHDWSQSHDTALSNITWKNKKGGPRGGSVANI
jgi:hypothetical protein